MSRSPRARYAAVAAAVVLLDQLTKTLVVRSLGVGESVPLIDGVVWLTHVRNPGAAFGVLRGFGGLLALAATVGVLVFASIIVKRPPPLVGLGAGLVAGGALGNLLDRAFRPWPFDGTVVDFVDLRFWPSFNVADAAITVGAVLLVVTGILDRDDKPAGQTEKDAAAADTDR